MYKSELHEILCKALKKTMWVQSTKDEDNFRHVICSSLYEFISPSNVEIPSTRSGGGDIRILDKKIELKYASSKKNQKLDDTQKDGTQKNGILKDFDALLNDEIAFSIVAIRLDVNSKKYLHPIVSLPMLGKDNSDKDFGNHTLIDTLTGNTKATYKGLSLFLAASYPHKLEEVTEKTGQQRKVSTAYLSYEQLTSIQRSSFLKISNDIIIHVDVIGSKEDGLIAFLYKKANGIELVNNNSSVNSCTLEIVNDNGAINIAKGSLVDVLSINNKPISQKNKIEENVWCFDITA